MPHRDDDWPALEDAIKRFVSAWRQGPRPAINNYLPADGELRYPLLIELVHTDLELRLKAGEAARVEEYLACYPELAGDTPAAVELIVAERELRRRGEPDLTLDDYLQRFPQYSRALSEQPAPTVAGKDPPRHQTNPHQETPADVPGYEILGPLGRGGMGLVYKARQQSVDRLVALKFLPAECCQDPEWLRRFRREAMTASALNHPHICTIYAAGECAGRPFHSMELIEGRTLEALVGQRLAVKELSRLLEQAARALGAAHAAGVVHRDIKPANLMVRDDGIVKVLDFGLARRLPIVGASGRASDSQQSDPGTLVGTLLYMAPEQARAELVGAASDIFSLGLVLYELATGRHPFQRDSEVGILHAIITETPLLPSRLNLEVAGPLEALLLRMLAKDSGLRPTAVEVDAALTELTRPSAGRAASPPPRSTRRPTVGRDQELALLRAGFASAAAGSGRVLCVIGEPGIGKTTLVEEFLADLAAGVPTCRIARGRCSERLAGAEAYLPVLEVLDGLSRGEAGESSAQALRLVAPAWYAQIVPHPAGSPTNQPTAPPSFQERLKRELLALLEEVSRQGPLVVFLDDVHWAGASTLDLLAYLGSRCAASRLLLVLTYRPTEMLLAQHPFVSAQLELQRHGVCREIPLGFLGRWEVENYLTLAFPGHRFPTAIVDLIHAKTEGNPLFLVDLLRYLRDREVIAEQPQGWALAKTLPDFQRELPESVRSLIQKKIAQPGEEDRRLLSAASIQGSEFDAVVVARVLGREAAEVEERLEMLDRVHGLVRLRREHEFHDGTLTLRYQFVHTLYQNALYAALQPTQKATWSATAAQTLLALHGEHGAAVAGELALLFEAARAWSRAVHYFLHAAENAVRVSAHQEAIVLARRGLELLQKLPDTPERATQELRLQMMRTASLQVVQGYSSSETGQACNRARVLCEQLGDNARLLPVLWCLLLFHQTRGELQTTLALAEQCLRLAQSSQDPALLVEAHVQLGSTLAYLADYSLVLEHCKQVRVLYDPEQHAAHAFLYGNNPLVVGRCFTAWALWGLGYPDQSRAAVEGAFTLARELAHPMSLANALILAAFLHLFYRDGPGAQELSEALIALAEEHGMAPYLAVGSIWRGWALADGGSWAEGAEQLRQGAALLLASGAKVFRTVILAALAEALAHQGQVEEGLASLAEALAVVQGGGERYWESGLQRLRGEILLRQAEAEPAVQAEAEACFRQAVTLAQQQKAKSCELRAVMSLSRLYQGQGRGEEARPLLAQTYGWFTEGFAIPDLRDAKALLEAVSDRNWGEAQS